MIDKDYKPHFLKVQTENIELYAQLEEFKKLHGQILDWDKRQVIIDNVVVPNYYFNEDNTIVWLLFAVSILILLFIHVLFYNASF